MSDDISMGEVGRRLADLAEEIRALRSEHVRRDLYEAHRASTDAAIVALTKRHETEIGLLRVDLAAKEADRVMMRRQTILAVASAGLALLVSIIPRLFG